MGNPSAQPVPAPPLAPPPLSLASVARQPARDTAGYPSRWDAGITYTPEDPCVGTIPTPVDPCDVTSGDLDLEVEPATVVWEPYLLHDGVTCTTLGQDPVRRFGDIARRRLQASQSAQIEQELEQGTLAQAAGWANRYFTDGTADTLSVGSGVALTHGLACLTQYLAETIHGGGVGMIHATPQVVTHWWGLDLLRLDGTLLRTWRGDVIIPGSGYSGAGPDGTAAADGAVWAYATGLVDVFLGQIDLDSVPSAGNVDRDTNDIEVRAIRMGLAAWDGCALGAVQLDVTACAIGGS